MKVRIARRFFLSLLAALLASGPIAGKEGFGSFKLMVELGRVRVPDIQVMGTEVAVRSSAESAAGHIQDQLIEALENELLSHDPDLELEPEHPQTVVEVTVRDHEFSVSVGSVDKRSTLEQMGLALTGRSSDTGTYQTVTHELTVAYQARDLTSGASLDKDTVVWRFEKTYDEDAPLSGEDSRARGRHHLRSSRTPVPARVELEEAAIAWVVHQIATRLTPSLEPINVLLPKGSLKSLGRQAQSGSWDRYVEELAGLPAKPTPVDESYRQYALGVAHEALGYAAKDPKVTLDYLEKAAVHFNAAIAANPDEEYFTTLYESRIVTIEFNERTGTSEVTPTRAFPPLQRLREAKIGYQKILDLRAARKEWLASLDGAGGAADEHTAGVLTNATIIKMTQAGLSEQIILTAVETAAATNFDISPQDLLALTEAEVSSRVIERMQAIAASRKDG